MSSLRRAVRSADLPTAATRLALLASIVVACTAGPAVAAERTLLLATTTSVQDTGLLDEILPAFTAASGISVKAVAVGSGAALRLGAEGNADVLLVHAPAAERALVESGAADRRVEVMENYFVLAGPPGDPAGVRETKSIGDALRAIHAKQAPFVSRADDSGTHQRETELFRAAGLDPDVRWPGLVRTGAGMGLSLQVAGQKGAYILSDVGTFLAFEKTTGLVTYSGEDPALRNVYSLLRVSPARFPAVHASEADAFIEYWQRAETAERIRAHGTKRLGRSLFAPLAVPRTPGTPPAR